MVRSSRLLLKITTVFILVALLKREKDPHKAEQEIRKIFAESLARVSEEEKKKKVRCPVLALIGEKDLQVPAKENLAAIEKALSAGGNKHFKVMELPGLNHLFQPANTGSPSEYPQIEETMSPKMLKIVADWLLQQTKD